MCFASPGLGWACSKSVGEDLGVEVGLQWKFGRDRELGIKFDDQLGILLIKREIRKGLGLEI